jgi:hypothetical protein
MRHLKVTAPTPDFWLPGLQAWAVRSDDIEPNAEPWAHIPHQHEVKRMIEGAGGAELSAPHLEGRIVAKVH